MKNGIKICDLYAAKHYNRPYPLTPRDKVDFYWRKNRQRAICLTMALCRKRGKPRGWSWERWVEDEYQKKLERDRYCKARGWRIWGNPARRDFRSVPLPLDGRGGPGHCRMCAQPIYALGWHKPWGSSINPNKQANWHACCGYVYSIMQQPLFLNGHEADHIYPLYRAFRDFSRFGDWPFIMNFWLPVNIQYLTPEEHKLKSKQEAQERAAFRKGDANVR